MKRLVVLVIALAAAAWNDKIFCGDCGAADSSFPVDVSSNVDRGPKRKKARARRSHAKAMMNFREEPLTYQKLKQYYVQRYASLSSPSDVQDTSASVIVDTGELLVLTGLLDTKDCITQEEMVEKLYFPALREIVSLRKKDAKAIQLSGSLLTYEMLRECYPRRGQTCYPLEDATVDYITLEDNMVALQHLDSEKLKCVITCEEMVRSLFIPAMASIVKLRQDASNWFQESQRQKEQIEQLERVQCLNSQVVAIMITASALKTPSNRGDAPALVADNSKVTSDKQKTSSSRWSHISIALNLVLLPYLAYCKRATLLPYVKYVGNAIANYPLVAANIALLTTGFCLYKKETGEDTSKKTNMWRNGIAYSLGIGGAVGLVGSLMYATRQG